MKIADHAHDRLRERTRLPDSALDALIARVAARHDLDPRKTYVADLSGKGYAVIAPVGTAHPKHVVKTVLGPMMRPPKGATPLRKEAQVRRVYATVLAEMEKDAGLRDFLPQARLLAAKAGKGATGALTRAQVAAATSPIYHRLLMNPATPSNMVGFLENPLQELGDRAVRGTVENLIARRPVPGISL